MFYVPGSTNPQHNEVDGAAVANRNTMETLLGSALETS